MAGDQIADPGLFQDSQQLMSLLNSVFGTDTTSSSTTTQELDPHTSDLLTQFLGTIMPELSSDRYSPEAAARDSKGAVDNIFRQYRQSIPSILGGSSSAGAYDSTTAQLLANDAFAKATADAGQLQLDTTSKYANIQNQTRSQITNLLLGLLAATRRTATNTASNNNASTNSARNAAAAASALRALSGGAGGKPANSTKPPGTSSQDAGKPSDDNSLQSQLDRENGSGPPSDNSGDITQQIIDSLSGADFGATPLDNIEEPQVGQLDNPDFDFSDTFSNFDFSGLFDNPDTGNPGDSSGGDSSSGDSNSDNSAPDSSGASGDNGDPGTDGFGDGSLDDF